MASNTTPRYAVRAHTRREWSRLERQMQDRAAEAALYLDVLPCPQCGSLALPCCDRR